MRSTRFAAAALVVAFLAPTAPVHAATTEPVGYAAILEDADLNAFLAPFTAERPDRKFTITHRGIPYTDGPMDVTMHVNGTTARISERPHGAPANTGTVYLYNLTTTPSACTRTATVKLPNTKAGDMKATWQCEKAWTETQSSALTWATLMAIPKQYFTVAAAINENATFAWDRLNETTAQVIVQNSNTEVGAPPTILEFEQRTNGYTMTYIGHHDSREFTTTVIFADTAKSVPSWTAVSKKYKSTITCVKGKTTKKVTAYGAKCPTGYKQRR